MALFQTEWKKPIGFLQCVFVGTSKRFTEDVDRKLFVGFFALEALDIRFSEPKNQLRVLTNIYRRGDRCRREILEMFG
jgi:hypothetical protein